MSESTLVITSDLHLGGGTAGVWGPRFSDEFTDDQAFVEFLRCLSPRPGSRLVFLGDAFDFLRVPVTGARTGLFARSEAEAVAQLDRIAAAHPVVMTALSDTLAAGVRVDFVSGNHDAELIRPAVRERLRALLGAPVGFHPWILYIPGLLYAEHGHHHHDINTFARPLYPYATTEGRLERPPAAWLGDLRRFPARPSRLWRDAITGLRGRPVHDLLARNQLAVPFYAFGHTHAAMRLPLGTNAWYLNSGTWSATTWGGARARRTWVEITAGAAPAAQLFQWTGAAEPLTDRRAPA